VLDCLYIQLEQDLDRLNKFTFNCSFQSTLPLIVFRIDFCAFSTSDLTRSTYSFTKTCIGAFPSPSLIRTSAPLPIKSCAIARKLLWTAQCSGENAFPLSFELALVALQRRRLATFEMSPIERATLLFQGDVEQDYPSADHETSSEKVIVAYFAPVSSFYLPSLF
jgi:hypothetical protein